jgi:endogenous inhibitor of DNA gyrase (YacG/DUF329 family)
MESLSKCPRCGSEFDVQQHRKMRGMKLFKVSLSEIHRSAVDEFRSMLLVHCPTCGFDYPSKDVRLVGIFRPATLRTLIVGGVVAMVLLGMCIFLME